MPQEITQRGGRPRKKFTPANVQKIKDFVAQGMGREDIARSLDVTLGSLQGFFFGSSDGTELEDDLKFIAKAREALAQNQFVLYSSWW